MKPSHAHDPAPSATALAALALALAACGGGGDVAPELVAGGGIHDPGIHGKVNVFVIDDDTDAPIEGAWVRVGTLEGTTDATGLFVASVDGKQTIVAKAVDH